MLLTNSNHFGSVLLGLTFLHPVYSQLTTEVETYRPTNPEHSTVVSYTYLKTSLRFGGYNHHFTVLSADATATTYLYNRTSPDPSRNICHVEEYARETVVNGPSTLEVTNTATSCGSVPARYYHLRCPLTGSPVMTATCECVYGNDSQSTTTMITLNASEVDYEPCTIVKGWEMLSQSYAATSTKSTTTTALTVDGTNSILPVPTVTPTATPTGTTAQTSTTTVQGTLIQTANRADVTLVPRSMFVSTLTAFLMMLAL